MSPISENELRRRLAGGDGPDLDDAFLADVLRSGHRVRRTRQGLAAGALALVLVAGVATGIGLAHGRRADNNVAGTTTSVPTVVTTSTPAPPSSPMSSQTASIAATRTPSSAGTSAGLPISLTRDSFVKVAGTRVSCVFDQDGKRVWCAVDLSEGTLLGGCVRGDVATLELTARTGVSCEGPTGYEDYATVHLKRGQRVEWAGKSCEHVGDGVRCSTETDTMTVTEASLSRTPEVAPAGDRYPSTTSLVASFGELPGPARLAHQGAKGWRPGTHLLRYCPDGPLLTYPALSDAIAVRTMFTQGPEHHETEMVVVFSDEASASVFLTRVA